MEPKGNIRITERDFAILELITKHRFLRSHHFTALIKGSDARILRRLRTLYDHGFIHRHPIRRSVKRWGGSEPLVYGMGQYGQEYLSRRSPALFERLSAITRQHQRNESIEHALMITDFMTHLERALNASPKLHFFDQETLRDAVPGKLKHFIWQVKVMDNNLPLRVGVYPDQVFGIRYLDGRPEPNTFFFLEADRATMPVHRRNLTQTSFYKKLVAYHATWKQNLHGRYFGFPSFRVLTLTTSAERVANMIEATERVTQGDGAGLFLFANMDSVTESNPLSFEFQTGKAGKTATLVSSEKNSR